MESSHSNDFSLSQSRQFSHLPPHSFVDKVVELEEEKLLDLIKFGTNSERKQAIMVVFDRHRQFVAKMISSKGIYGSDAEDIFGEIWKIIIEKIVEFQHKGIPLVHWFSKITRIQIDAFFRKKGDENGRFTDTDDNFLETIAVVKDVLESKQAPELTPWMRHLIQNVLPNLLEQLSEKEREVIQLTFIDGLDSTQIAAMLGIKSGTVRQRKRRALNKLKGLGEKGIDNELTKS